MNWLWREYRPRQQWMYIGPECYINYYPLINVAWVKCDGYKSIRIEMGNEEPEVVMRMMEEAFA